MTDGSVTLCGLTSPAQGACQLAAQESSPDDGDGLQLSGNFLQRFEILNLCRRERRKNEEQSYCDGALYNGTMGSHCGGGNNPSTKIIKGEHDVNISFRHVNHSNGS